MKDYRLIFEHLVCDNLYNCYNVGASMYDACLSNDDGYKNGFKVGRIYGLIYGALSNLKEKVSIEKQTQIQSILDQMSSPCSFEDINSIIKSLVSANIINQ